MVSKLSVSFTTTSIFTFISRRLSWYIYIYIYIYTFTPISLNCLYLDRDDCFHYWPERHLFMLVGLCSKTSTTNMFCIGVDRPVYPYAESSNVVSQSLIWHLPHLRETSRLFFCPTECTYCEAKITPKVSKVKDRLQGKLTEIMQSRFL